MNCEVKIGSNQCDIPKPGQIINIGLKKAQKITSQFTINQGKVDQVSKSYSLFWYIHNQKSPKGYVNFSFNMIWPLE